MSVRNLLCSFNTVKLVILFCKESIMLIQYSKTSNIVCKESIVNYNYSVNIQYNFQCLWSFRNHFFSRFFDQQSSNEQLLFEI